MKYRILSRISKSSKHANARFLIPETKKWHFSRSIPIKKDVQNIINKKKKCFYDPIKKEWISDWACYIYINFTNEIFYDCSDRQKIVLYKPRNNKKGIRVMMNKFRGYNKISNIKEYVLCKNIEEIEQAIYRYISLNSLFG